MNPPLPRGQRREIESKNSKTLYFVIYLTNNFVKCDAHIISFILYSSDFIGKQETTPHNGEKKLISYTKPLKKYDLEVGTIGTQNEKIEKKMEKTWNGLIIKN